MTRAEARERGWKLMVPMEGSRNPAVQAYLKDPKELAKLDSGMWLDEKNVFVCWEVDFDHEADRHGLRPGT